MEQTPSVMPEGQKLGLSEKQGMQGLTSPLELFKNAWQAYQVSFKRFATMTSIGVLGTLPLYVLSLVFKFSSKNLSGPLTMILFLLLIVFTLVSIYIVIRSEIGVYLLMKVESTETVKSIFAKTQPLFWPYFGLSLLVGIIVMLWTLLFIVPGIIMGIFYMFSIYAFLFAEQRGKQAMKFSKQLVKGYWWAVFGRLCFLILIIIIFSALLGTPNVYFEKDTLPYDLWDGAMNIVTMYFMPIALLYFYAIFKQLAKIKKLSDI